MKEEKPWGVGFPHHTLCVPNSNWERGACTLPVQNSRVGPGDMCEEDLNLRAALALLLAAGCTGELAKTVLDRSYGQ